jgi:carbon dioxide concentrating mechanism protein CcmO
MIGALGLLETTGLTPAMVAIDAMTKTAAVRVMQVELNDLYGVCVKITGSTADVQTAIATGRRVADEMRGSPIVTVLTRVSTGALPAIRSQPEFSPLIQQPVVFEGDEAQETSSESATGHKPKVMSQETPQALGFIETQGFTAVFEAIDTACKAASVEVVGKEKLGGGYVTIVIQGQLAAVTAAVDSGKQKVDGLGKLIAAHVIARPSEAVLKLLPKL